MSISNLPSLLAFSSTFLFLPRKLTDGVAVPGQLLAPETRPGSLSGPDRQPDSWLLAEMLAGIAWNYLEIAEYEKAEYYYDKALVYAPDNIGIIVGKAHLYWIMRQHDKSLAMRQRIMEISPLTGGFYL